ncbi:AAA family ATPase, partial [Acinetobacter baumannii]
SKIAEIAWLDSDSAPPLFLLDEYIKKNLFEACFKTTFPEVFIASAERTGASIFRNELNFNKNQLVSLLAEMEKNGNKKFNPFDIARSFKRTYAQSVEHNVDFISYRIENLVKKGQSEFIKKNAYLLAKFQEIAGGVYKYHKDTGVYFQPNGARGVKLGLGEASSAVRSLMIIWFWLNHVAKPNSLLMIDEPELNLHPENQRKLAKFVAALVSAGVRVFMTTHSDYIIRELNTLVMLSCDKPHIQKVRDKFNYDDNDFIKPENIAVYNTTEDLFEVEGSSRRKKMGTIERWDVVEHVGIKIQSFDKEIREMNKVQDALRYGI